VIDGDSTDPDSGSCSHLADNAIKFTEAGRRRARASSTVHGEREHLTSSSASSTTGHPAIRAAEAGAIVFSSKLRAGREREIRPARESGKLAAFELGGRINVQTAGTVKASTITG
jgi:hypothetical protein